MKSLSWSNYLTLAIANQNNNTDLFVQLKEYWQDMGLLTKILLLLNILVFIVQSLIHINSFEYIICLKPFLEGQFYRILTSTFSHADLRHIFFNMITLLIFSPQLEKHHGTVDYLLNNILLIIGSSLISILILYIASLNFLGGPEYYFHCALGYSGILYG